MQSSPKTFVEMFELEHPPARLSEAVVVIIDMQREYLDGAVPLPDIHTTVQAAAQLLLVARAQNTPVIHVLNQGPTDGQLFNPEGPYFAQLPAVAAHKSEAIVIKHLPNAFAATNLHALIQATGRNQLILAGLTTHVCLSSTARAALDLGYQSTIVASATTSRDLADGFGTIIPAAQVKKIALAELRDAFAVIVKTPDDLLS